MRATMRTISFAAVCAAAVLGTVLTTALTGCSATPERVVVLGNESVSVEVVADDASRSRGLQEHDSLQPGTGMLFSWDDAQVRTFAMKEVSFPIDIVFIGEDFRVASIVTLQPGDPDPVSGPTPSMYVLELPAGWAREHGIDVGSPFVPPAGG